ncbi:MAG: hypothetical protein P4L16_03595 [Chlamydiales bacterium]|nr:hypothetical protein [Chlamydiales bacterium]
MTIAGLQKLTTGWTSFHEDLLQISGIPIINMDPIVIGQTLFSSVQIIGGIALTAISGITLTVGYAFHSKNIKHIGIDCGQEAIKWIKNGSYYFTLAAVNILSLGLFGYISKIYLTIEIDLFINQEIIIPVEKMSINRFGAHYLLLYYNSVKAIYSFCGTIFFAMGKLIGFNTSDRTRCTLSHLKESVSALPINLLNTLFLGVPNYLIHIKDEEARAVTNYIQKTLSECQAFPTLGLISSVAKAAFSTIEMAYALTGLAVYEVAAAILYLPKRQLSTICHERALIAGKDFSSNLKHLSYSVLNLATLGIASGFIERTGKK